ncbi:hypothetical protein E3J38_04215 [candidate division TA06 bacterium]|uniref:Uncharacterized protein n=1 Tax=candidate division TA06 bacterium TaxID=2250710 RepID=A0A523XPM4_UNCT6|nr:MAG: hypothetical protein E3J38_04215 [candidate division TA06 bacterium]
MCSLYKNARGKTIKGYKIVAKKKGVKGYFSLAMGFKYLENKDIPKVKEQKRLTGWFAPTLLEDYNGGHSRLMEGRTAIFLGRVVAFETARAYKYEVAKGIKVAVVAAEVSKAVMTGRYRDGDVAAGRRIKFGKETRERR